MDERSSRVLRRFKKTYIGGFSESSSYGSPTLNRHDFGTSRAPRAGNDFSPRVSIAYQPRRRHNFYASFLARSKRPSFRSAAARPPWPSRQGPRTCSSSCAFKPGDRGRLRERWEVHRGRAYKGHRFCLLLQWTITDVQVARLQSRRTRTGERGRCPIPSQGITTNAPVPPRSGASNMRANAALAEDAFVQGDPWNLNWAVVYFSMPV